MTAVYRGFKKCVTFTNSTCFYTNFVEKYRYFYNPSKHVFTIMIIEDCRSRCHGKLYSYWTSLGIF